MSQPGCIQLLCLLLIWLLLLGEKGLLFIMLQCSCAMGAAESAVALNAGGAGAVS